MSGPPDLSISRAGGEPVRLTHPPAPVEEGKNGALSISLSLSALHSCRLTKAANLQASLSTTTCTV